jgi:hypothetical protein
VKMVCLSVCLFLSLFACLCALGTPYDAKMAKFKNNSISQCFCLWFWCLKYNLYFCIWNQIDSVCFLSFCISGRLNFTSRTKNVKIQNCAAFPLVFAHVFDVVCKFEIEMKLIDM